MTTYDYDLGILGGGAAGLTAAAGAAQFGARVLLSKSTKNWGATACTLGVCPQRLSSVLLESGLLRAGQGNSAFPI